MERRLVSWTNRAEATKIVRRRAKCRNKGRLQLALKAVKRDEMWAQLRLTG